MRTSLCVLFVLFAVVPLARGQAPTHYRLSADVPVAVSPVTAADADVLDLDPASSTWTAVNTLSAVLPAGVGVDAIHTYANGDVIFSPDVAFSWAGGSAGDEDLVLYSGGSFSLLFDGSAAGIPPGIGIDAVAVIVRSPLQFLFSVDDDTTLGGNPVTDDDIVRFTAPSSFAVVTAGNTWLGAEASRADVDGLAAPAGSPVMYVSLDVSTSLGGGLTPDDEDIVQLVSGSPTGVVDVSGHGFPGPGADVDALAVQLAPELASASLNYAIVNTATQATWSVDYTDRDGDAPATGSPSLSVDGGPGAAMNQVAACGNPWCDGEYSNGERFEIPVTVGYGAGHGWAIDASEGVDGATQVTGSGPSWVSAPGDADGDTDHDAGDLAVILIENFDGNGGANLDLVRGGSFTSSWGGTDADSNHQVTAADLPAALAVIF